MTFQHWPSEAKDSSITEFDRLMFLFVTLLVCAVFWTLGEFSVALIFLIAFNSLVR